MAQVETLAERVGVRSACQALGVPRSSRYARRQPRVSQPRTPTAPPRAMSQCEKDSVRQLLNSPRFVDQAPREVYATLLDEGRYQCSIASMYRILAENQEVGERRNQRRHPIYPRPELMATAPNQAWTWDISRLLGVLRGVYYFLYVLLDMYSRYVVGWLIAEQESAHWAAQLISETCDREQIEPNQLRLHSDRGAPMVSHALTQLFERLGLSLSLARPRTPDDNPYSESQFKTAKYHFTYPGRFNDVQHARRWGQTFMGWYNEEHHHTGLGLLTPAVVHAGQAAQYRAKRQQVLTQAYAAHPERFVNGPPQPPALPAAVFINPPQPGEKASTDTPDAP